MVTIRLGNVSSVQNDRLKEKRSFLGAFFDLHSHYSNNSGLDFFNF